MYRPLHPTHADKAQILLLFGLGDPKLTPVYANQDQWRKQMARKGIQNEELITVDGYVEEVKLEDGNIGIVVNDGDNDYFVVLDKKGKKLSRHVDEEVEVSGTLSEKDGEFWLKVTYFHLIDYYEDMYDDDGYDPGYDDRWST